MDYHPRVFSSFSVCSCFREKAPPFPYLFPGKQRPRHFSYTKETLSAPDRHHEEDDEEKTTTTKDIDDDLEDEGSSERERSRDDDDGVVKVDLVWIMCVDSFSYAKQDNDISYILESEANLLETPRTQLCTSPSSNDNVDFRGLLKFLGALCHD